MENGKEHTLENKEITPEQLDNEIRERANQICIERGANPGSALQDWLQAEKEIKEKYKLS